MLLGCAIPVLAILTALLIRRRFKAPASSTATYSVILGSGGHTTEMLMLLEAFDFGGMRKLVVVHADSDPQSVLKFTHFLRRRGVPLSSAQFVPIKRPSNVGDGLATSLLRTIWSTATSAATVYRLDHIDYLMCNGPGICVPVILLLRLKNVSS